MRRHRRFLVGCAVAASALALLAAPAGAATAVGCTGDATSIPKDGTADDPVDTVTAPGPKGTQDNPFLVDYDGTVQWSGTTEQVIQNGKWTVYMWPFDFDGKVTNSSGNTSDDGVRVVKDDIPIKIPGLAYVKVEVTGQGGTKCVAAGWVKFTGSPTGTTVWWTALLLLIFGGVAGALLILWTWGSGSAAVPAGEEAAMATMSQAALGVVTERGDEVRAEQAEQARPAQPDQSTDAPTDVPEEPGS